MKKYFSIIYKEEYGEIMLESMIIIILTLFVLIAILSLGFFYYQQSMMTTVANEIASKIGAGYKYILPLDEYEITQDALENTKMYRIISRNKISNLNKGNLSEYLPDRVGLTSLGIDDSVVNIDSFEIVPDNVGRLHLEVQISMKSNFLFSGALEYFGIFRETPTVTATGRAECLDITAYAGQVKFLEYLKRKEVPIVDDVISIVGSVINIFE